MYPSPLARQARPSLVAVLILLLSGCVYLPTTVSAPTDDCQTYTPAWVVTGGNVWLGCSGDPYFCLAMNIIPITSGVISAAVVMTGNLVNGLERLVRCRDEQGLMPGFGSDERPREPVIIMTDEEYLESLKQSSD